MGLTIALHNPVWNLEFQNFNTAYVVSKLLSLIPSSTWPLSTIRYAMETLWATMLFEYLLDTQISNYCVVGLHYFIKQNNKKKKQSHIFRSKYFVLFHPIYRHK